MACWEYVHVYAEVLGEARGGDDRSSGAGLRGGFGPPDVGAGI